MVAGYLGYNPLRQADAMPGTSTELDPSLTDILTEVVAPSPDASVRWRVTAEREDEAVGRRAFDFYRQPVAISADGNIVFVVDAERGLTARDAVGGQVAWALKALPGVERENDNGDLRRNAPFAVSADGNTLIVQSPTRAEIDARTGTARWVDREGFGWLDNRMHVSPDGSWHIAYGHRGSNLRLMRDGEVVLEQPLDQISPKSHPGTWRFHSYGSARQSIAGSLHRAATRSPGPPFRLDHADERNRSWTVDSVWPETQPDRRTFVIRNGRLSARESRHDYQVEDRSWQGIEYYKLSGRFRYLYRQDRFLNLKSFLTDDGGRANWLTPATVRMRSGTDAAIRIDEQTIQISTRIDIERQRTASEAQADDTGRFLAGIGYDADDLLRDLAVASGTEPILADAENYQTFTAEAQINRLEPVDVLSRWQLDVFASDAPAIDPEARTITLGTWDGTVRCYDLLSGHEHWRVSVGPRPNSSAARCCSPPPPPANYCASTRQTARCLHAETVEPLLAGESRR